MLDDDDSLRSAIAAGARGYLLKEATPQEIVGSIESVVAGQAGFGSAVSGRVLAALATSASPRGLDGITDRESEVLDLLARGLTNAAIADRLGLSGKTIRNHVSNIFSKLGVADRAAAVAKARDAGYGRARNTAVGSGDPDAVSSNTTSTVGAESTSTSSDSWSRYQVALECSSTAWRVATSSTAVARAVMPTWPWRFKTMRSGRTWRLASQSRRFGRSCEESSVDVEHPDLDAAA